ncbi:GGDEF domain-containing protein [Kushneria aurantia]|uniref:diguanylate cyclase n=1 Tax=Kushneria aurantia TaxID=504092 RepID=A0ABV6G2A0_9GAMM|nr:GGDEF domain-containing protein [Kushneria aurantia]
MAIDSYRITGAALAMTTLLAPGGAAIATNAASSLTMALLILLSVSTLLGWWLNGRAGMPLRVMAAMPAALALAVLVLLTLSFLLPVERFDYDFWSSLFAHWPIDTPFYIQRPALPLLLAMLLLALLQFPPGRGGASGALLIVLSLILTVVYLINESNQLLHEHSSAFYALLPALLLLLAIEAHQRRQLLHNRAVQLALAPPLAVLLLVLLLWENFSEQHIQRLSQVAAIESETLTTRLHREVAIFNDAIHRFANGWDSTGTEPDTRQWQHRAAALVGDFYYLRDIAWISWRSHHIERFYPVTRWPNATNQQWLADKAFDALDNESPSDSAATTLTQRLSNRRLMLYRPVVDLDNGRQLGAIAFAVSPTLLLESVFQPLYSNDFLVRVTFDDQLIYRLETADGLSSLRRCSPLMLADSRFTMCIEATYARLFIERHSTPSNMLLVGLIIAWLLYMLTWYYLGLRNRFSGVQYRNHQLRNRVRDEDARRRKAEWGAHHDALTGLLNRRGFGEWVALNGLKPPLTLMVIDIDHFKQVNDRLGHTVGDDYLRRVTDTLNALIVKRGGLLARYGGEEFIACLPDTDIVEAETIGEVLRHRIEAMALPHHKRRGVVTVSIGMVTARREGEHLEALFSLADQALYRAKQQGRNRVDRWHWH